MNTNRTLIASVLAFAAFALAACGDSDHHEHSGSGHDDHGHEHATGEGDADKEFAKEPGPNGGRLVTSVDPAVELVVADDRKVTLSFFDAQRNPVKPGPYEFAMIGGERSNPTRLEFEASGDSLVSNAPLPAGEGFPVILEITNQNDGSVTRERFNYASYSCSGCGLKEYACICGH